MAGSHPHWFMNLLVHLANEREPFPNAHQSANITCVGILTHESAMQEGKQIYLPEFNPDFAVGLSSKTQWQFCVINIGK